jgi:predicted dehydrogenase
LGEVESVHATTARHGGLDLDVEDTAQVTLRFASGALGSVYLDYVARPPIHGLRIIGRYGSITWRAEDGIARLYRRGVLRGQVKSSLHFERNTLFMNEARHFLECLRGQEAPACSLQDGTRALDIVLAAKQSARERRDIGIRPSL